MAAQTGRTVGRWVNFLIGDATNVLRNINVKTINGVGLDYPAKDVTALQDAIKNALPETPDLTVEITGDVDNSAVAAAPALSGAHTVLSVLAGDPTPRTLDVQIGIQHAWEAGEPQFGISRTATSGVIVTKYVVNPSDATYVATIKVKGGIAPAWGTVAET